MTILSSALSSIGDLVFVAICVLLAIAIPMAIYIKISQMNDQSKLRHEKWLVDLKRKNESKKQQEKEMYKRIEQNMMRDFWSKQEDDKTT